MNRKTLGRKPRIRKKIKKSLQEIIIARSLYSETGFYSNLKDPVEVKILWKK